MVILPIGSGKGGVGKSLLAANLAIALSEAGRRVVLADLDLGASNAHTMLGVRSVSCGIGTFLTTPRTRFEQITLSTDYEGLSFIPGDAEIPGTANLKAGQKNRLLRHLQALEADFLVLDLGPGTAAHTLDFFLLSAGGVVVTTPSLTAILNAYLFLKNAVFRIMHSTVERESRAFAILEELRRDAGTMQRAYVPRILDRIGEEDPRSRAALDAVIGRFRPRLVLNLLEDPGDAERTDKLRRSAREYLGIELTHLGIIYRDELQDAALASRIPIIRWKPAALLSRAVYRIAEKLLTVQPEAALVDPGVVEEGFQAAESEAEIDFQAKRRDIEDLLQSGALTTGDLVETVRGQIFELSTLRRENGLLRARLLKAVQEGFRP
jgi:flagellar biosynthesis protein FlhG